MSESAQEEYLLTPSTPLQQSFLKSPQEESLPQSSLFTPEGSRSAGVSLSSAFEIKDSAVQDGPYEPVVHKKPGLSKSQFRLHLMNNLSNISFFGLALVYNINAIKPSSLVFNGVGFGLFSIVALISLTALIRLFYLTWQSEDPCDQKMEMFSLFCSILGFGGLAAKCIGFGFHNEMYNLIFYGSFILMVLAHFRAESYTIKIIGESSKIIHLNRYLNTNTIGLLLQMLGLYAFVNCIMPISQIKPFDITLKPVLLTLLGMGIVGGIVSIGAYHAFYNDFNKLLGQTNQRYLNVGRTLLSTLTSVFVCTFGLLGYLYWSHHAFVSGFDIGITMIASFIMANLLMRYLPASPCCGNVDNSKYDTPESDDETTVVASTALRKMTSMVEY